MKIKVKTSIGAYWDIPILGKVLNRFGILRPVIEGYEAWYEVEYTDLDSKDTIPILSIKPVIIESHGIEGGINRWAYKPWFEGGLIMKFYPSVSGYIELRVYFKNLKDSDEIIDDYGRNQAFRGNIGPDKNIRYYYKSFKVYSLYEVLIIFFTSTVTVFTILLFIITVLLVVR